MDTDYGHFADGSSAANGLCRAIFSVLCACGLATTRRTSKEADLPDQLTPSFFCRLDDEVVY
jgi:hypothetical protein